MRLKDVAGCKHKQGSTGPSESVSSLGFVYYDTSAQKTGKHQQIQTSERFDICLGVIVYFLLCELLKANEYSQPHALKAGWHDLVRSSRCHAHFSDAKSSRNDVQELRAHPSSARPRSVKTINQSAQTNIHHHHTTRSSDSRGACQQRSNHTQSSTTPDQVQHAGKWQRAPHGMHLLAPEHSGPSAVCITEAMIGVCLVHAMSCPLHARFPFNDLANRCFHTSPGKLLCACANRMAHP